MHAHTRESQEHVFTNHKAACEGTITKPRVGDNHKAVQDRLSRTECATTLCATTLEVAHVQNLLTHACVASRNTRARVTELKSGCKGAHSPHVRLPEEYRWEQSSSGTRANARAQGRMQAADALSANAHMPCSCAKQSFDARVRDARVHVILPTKCTCAHSAHTRACRRMTKEMHLGAYTHAYNHATCVHI